MAERVTKTGRRDRRFSNQAIGFQQQGQQQGYAAPVKQGLGEMPLTLWLIVAAVILYLYIRRASLGIDKHPGEQVKVKPSVPVLSFISGLETVPTTKGPVKIFIPTGPLQGPENRPQ